MLKSPFAVLLAGSVSLAGCAAGPDYVRPSPPDARSYVGQDGDEALTAGADGVESQRLFPAEEAPSGWWRWFGSAEIEALVAKAFEDNPSLDATRARLRAANATLSARRGLRVPELLAQASASYGTGGVAGVDGTGTQAVDTGGTEGDPSDPQGGGTPTGPDAGEPDDPNGTDGGQAGTGGFTGDDAYAVYTLGATVSYDLDLAGGNRRLVEAALAEVERGRQELQAAALALAGNVVSTVLEAAALNAQLEAREELIAGQEERLALIRVRVEEGADARADLLTARTDLAALQATVPPLRAQLAATRNALAALTGVPPTDETTPLPSLASLNLPSDVPITLPSRLVRTRPDILASEAVLQAASARIGVQTANLYPNLTLDATFGVGGPEGAIDTVYDLGAGLFMPIFDGGRRRAERDVAVAAYEEALALYRDRVLSAFVEVADGIRALEADADTLAAQAVALEAASDSFDLALFRLDEGEISPIEVSVVQQRYQEARFAYIDALAQRFQDTARLLAALGAGPAREDALAAAGARTHLAATRAALEDGMAPAAVVNE